MPRGQPDYSNPQYTFAQSYSEPALLSLAVAGFSSPDQLGRPIILETFSEGYGSWEFYPSFNSTYELYTVRPYIAPFCLRLSPSTGVSGGVVLMQIRPGWGLEGRYGFEMAYRLGGFNGVLYFGMRRYAGNVGSWGGVVALKNRGDGAGQVDVSTPGGWITLVEGWDMPDPTHWNIAKLIADFTVKKYVRLYVGGMMFDLSDYDLTFTSPYLGASQLVFLISSNYESGWVSDPHHYIGYVLFSKDEP